jgi:hypothetical protein
VIIPPFTAMTFPYTYGSTASGNGIIEIKTSGATIGQPMIDSIWFKSNVIAAHSVAAAGNMIVPAGTFPALLERQVTTTVDSAWIKSPLTLNMWLAAPGFPITTTDSSFNWYSDQSLQKFAHAIYDSTGISDVVFFKSSTTGIANPVSYEPVTLYPNPANNTIYFSNASMLQEMQLHLFDVNGKEVLQGYGHIEKLDVSKLSSGVYFLRMNSSGRPSHTYRIVKE